MSSRIHELEARRQQLLNQCEEQRLELAYRLAQITPKAALTAWSRRSGRTGGTTGMMPLIAGVGGLLMMLLRRRRRRRRSRGGGAGVGVGLITTVLALTTRATTILRIFARLRSLYVTYKATRRPERH
jgi:hypothetical protein